MKKTVFLILMVALLIAIISCSPKTIPEYAKQKKKSVLAEKIAAGVAIVIIVKVVEDNRKDN